MSTAARGGAIARISGEARAQQVVQFRRQHGRSRRALARARSRRSSPFDAEFMDVAHQHLGRNAVLFPSLRGLRAAAAQISRWVLRQGLTPVAAALVVGLAVSLGVNGLLRSQLIGVEPYDPLTMAAASAVLVIVDVLACRVPARRAIAWIRRLRCGGSEAHSRKRRRKAIDAVS